MTLVGLTGGIGCGKTTVLHVFEEMGVPCFIADTHAASYYEEPEFLQSISSLLGNEVFDSQGKADKREIASIVFNDKEKLQALNAMIHPRVMNDFHKWAEQQKSEYVILESAIIFEYGLQRHLDKVVTVYLEKEERIKRLEIRDGVSRDILEARMRNQLSAEEKMDLADYVILNYEGNPRRRQVEYIDRLLRK
ncbi:MAG: dephospho-CoA kinase [Bacteroidales bacterium]|nr:dephospho-CoA kinase [Bacteroidales bacterium]